MKKLLFVNACIRDNSRTNELTRRYLEVMKKEYDIEEVNVSTLNIRPFDAAALIKRDEDAVQSRLTAENYPLAHQFAKADCIVIAAPYWDCLFPAILRVYLEHICVAGITFAYDDNGGLVKTCNADKLIYVTTCGGFLPEHSSLEGFVHEIGELFSIHDIQFYAAQGLDVYPDKAQTILEHTLEEMK